MEGNAHCSTNFPILPSVFGGREFGPLDCGPDQSSKSEGVQARPGSSVEFELISDTLPTQPLFGRSSASPVPACRSDRVDHLYTGLRGTNVSWPQEPGS